MYKIKIGDLCAAFPLLSTYYNILGVTPLAGIAEIKTAFRRLAKLYHPDKNPGEKEKFATILKAYETLIDPDLRAAYDRKIRYQQDSSQAKERSRTKNWTFEEREQRRRKYYEEHIKKYEKPRQNFTNTEPSKNTYNEYKYILFATPLAVALLLLIIRLASPEDETSKKTNRLSSNYENVNLSIKFGEQQYDTIQGIQITLHNRDLEKVELYFFLKQKFIRTCTLISGSVEVLTHFPEGFYSMRVLLTEADGRQTFYSGKTLLNLREKQRMDISREWINGLQEIGKEKFYILNPTQP